MSRFVIRKFKDHYAIFDSSTGEKYYEGDSESDLKDDLKELESQSVKKENCFDECKLK